jgi:hypothetical protein
LWKIRDTSKESNTLFVDFIFVKKSAQLVIRLKVNGHRCLQ